MRRLITIAAIAAAALGAGAGAASARPAPFVRAAFTPASATAMTQVTGDPDSGHGTPAVWADDSFTRMMTVTQGAAVPAADCGAASGPCWAYSASLRDSGSFTAIPGAGTPNQSCAGCAGLHVASAVSGSLYGTYAITLYASALPDASLVPAGHDDGGVAPSPPYTSTTWPELFFPAGTHFGGVAGGAYSWTYTVAFPRQQWADSSSNGDGNQPQDGNIYG